MKGQVKIPTDFPRVLLVTESSKNPFGNGILNNNALAVTKTMLPGGLLVTESSKNPIW